MMESKEELVLTRESIKIWCGSLGEKGNRSEHGKEEDEKMSSTVRKCGNMKFVGKELCRNL